MAFRAARLRKEWLNILFNLVFAILTLILTILFYRSVWLAVGLLVIVMVFGMLKWRGCGIVGVGVGVVVGEDIGAIVARLIELSTTAESWWAKIRRKANTSNK